MTKKQGAELLEHIIKVHKDRAPETIWKWMNMAFDCCTKMGVSFGFYELLELGTKIKGNLTKITKLSQDEQVNIEELNKYYQDAANDCLDNVLRNTSMDMDAPAIHFAAMALSGARGGKQVRQLIAGRGFLSPGAIPFDAEDERFVFASSLVDGMDPDGSFYAAMNSRSSICDKKLGTPSAGYLTRKLVFAMWPYPIVMDDCGYDEGARSPITCKAERGFCSKCYGPLPDSEAASIGFPAGLVAAQSIGERGTQLSMQSFHTGAREIDIKGVERMLNNPELFEDSERADKFITQLKKSNAYKDLEDRHLQVLWRVIRDSEEKTLRSSTFNASILTRTAFESQKSSLFNAALNEKVDPLEEPVAKILVNNLS